MAITVETATRVTGGAQGIQFSDSAFSDTIAIQSAEGARRIVRLCVSAASGQVGDLSFSGVQLAGAPPTGFVVGNDSLGPVKDGMLLAWWDDAALPPTAGIAAVEWTTTNNGAGPVVSYDILELSGVDQTANLSPGTPTSNFGTSTQAYADGGADLIECMMARGTASALSGLVTVTDIEDVDRVDAHGSAASALAVGRSTDGAIAATSSEDWAGTSFVGWSYVAAAASPGGLGQLWVQGALSIDALSGLSVQTATGIVPVAAIWLQGPSSINKIWESA